jgi:hypothetical protein
MNSYFIHKPKDKERTMTVMENIVSLLKLLHKLRKTVNVFLLKKQKDVCMSDILWSLKKVGFQQE